MIRELHQRASRRRSRVDFRRIVPVAERKGNDHFIAVGRELSIPDAEIFLSGEDGGAIQNTDLTLLSLVDFDSDVLVGSADVLWRLVFPVGKIVPGWSVVGEVESIYGVVCDDA
jgi:hypothetical protein